MRYEGPEPFPGETLGDLWDLPDGVRGMVERAQAETAEANKAYADQCRALWAAEEQVSFASSLLDDLDIALQSATRLRDFRKTFTRLVRESPFEED